MAKAVIFDVDGTLVDSVDLHAKAWVEAFADFGYAFDFAAVRREIGKGGDQLLPVFLSQEDIEEKGKDIEAHRGDLFKARYFDSVRAFPGVRALFQRLLDEGLKIALASSAKGDELQRYKDVAGIADLVDAETSSDDADRSKPHPDIFEAALGRLEGIAEADVVVVGDTPHDAEAAKRAGLRTIGLTCGGWEAGELAKAACIAVYRDPEDLLARLEGSPILAA